MATFQVHKIYWKQDSPFGTFVQGDVIDIFWDDVAEDFDLELNGAPLTSGNDIPYFFTYSGQTEGYYKTEEHFFALICNTSNAKIDTYRNVSAFPYMQAVPYPDHPSCAASPVVCDLVFSSLPVVVNASSESASDGEVTVVATSSNGSIEYNIGGDFVYGSGTASGNFTGLTPGSYIVYARDEVNCSAEILVDIGIDYSYGTLLQIIYNDKLNNPTKIELLQKSYSGSVTEVDGAGHSCYYYSLRGEGENDKFKTIISTESTLSLVSISNFQFIDLFTGDPDKYRVRFSKDTGSGYEVKLLHKFLPNQYSETYKNSPYPAEFIATDGTPTLKDIPFTDSAGGRLYGSYNQISIIAFILKKIGLGLNIRCAINLYADGMDETDSDDPLDQAFINTDTYYLQGNNPSCEEVILSILEPYGAQLIMWDNVWNILRLEERVASFDYREFDENGAYVSDSSYNPVKDSSTKSDSELIWLAFPTMEMKPGFGRIAVKYNLGLDNNTLVNGDFRLKKIFDTLVGQFIVVPNIDGFQIIYQDQNVDALNYEVISDTSIALRIFAISGLYILSDTYDIKMSIADKIKFKVSYKLSPVYRDYPYQKIKCQLVYGTYYLQSNGTWTTTANTIVYYAKDFGKYTDFEIIAGQPDTSAINGLDIYVKIFASYVLDAEYLTLANLKAKATTTLALATRTELLPSSTGSGVDTAYIYYFELENNTSAESVPDIVRPNDYNAVTNPVQWILKKQLTSSTTTIDNNFYLDRIAVEYLPEGKDPAKVYDAEISAEANNPSVFTKELNHGSLTSDIQTNLQLVVPAFGEPFFSLITIGTENADKIYKGYLKNSTGAGFVNWSRDNVTESRLLHEIYLRSLSAQYSRPWRKISGTLVSETIYFTPIDTLRETLDSDRKYYPIGMRVDDYRNEMDGEFVELLDVTDEAGEPGGGGGSGSGLGFTLGFTIGFDA